MSISYNLSLPQVRATIAQLTATNEVLLTGQLCVETDTSTTTVGDGVNNFLTLRGNIVLSSEQRQSADDVYATGVTGITRYRARITQNGTNDPEVTVLQNNTGYVIQWVREDEGRYVYSGTPGTESFSVLHNVLTDGNDVSGFCTARDGVIKTFDADHVAADSLLEVATRQEVIMDFHPGL